MRLSPLTRRRLAAFRANRRGVVCLWVFVVLFGASLFAEFVANDRPLVMEYRGQWYFPVVADYPGTDFGPDFLPTEADYTDPAVKAAIRAHGWMLWPLVPYHYDTIVNNLPSPAPSPPTWQNWLGTDDQARDVLARVIYGFRISVLFGFTLTIVSSVVGIAAGAVQGFYGGLIDLFGQRGMEIGRGCRSFFCSSSFPASSRRPSGCCSSSCSCSAG